jgi:hypothetical protein
MSIKRLIAGLAGAPLVAGLAMPALVFAADPVVVTSVDTQGWSSTETMPGGSVSFVTDSSAPAGSGALQLKTDGTNAAKAKYMHAANVALSDVTTLSYQTKQVAGPRSLDNASYQLPVDLDNNGTFDMTLVYEPYYNGTVTPGVWQTWNVKDGLFWPTKADASLGGTTGGGAYATNFTLQHVLDVYPDAQVLGYGVNVGTYNPSTTANVDNFVFNDTTYNFEVFQPTGEITSPAEGDHVRGTVTLSATYNDGDNDNDDAVQWALRSSCNDNTTTKAGNVDTFNTPSNWDGANFSATVDTSTLDPGSYCFVFNPTDDAGQNNVRETRTFFVDANAPYNKDECKNDGWQSFTAPTFKNQGDCVSFIASNGKAKGNPTPAVHVMANNPRF